MIELLQEALEEYFSDFKQYQLIILILFTIVIAIFQIIQTVLVSQKIERFKTLLKKSEIKFSRYHNLQVDALKSIYNKLVLFNGANYNLFRSKFESNSHRLFKNRIDNWMKTYVEFVNEFSCEKILLPNHLKCLVRRTIVDFEAVKNILIDQKDDLDYFEEVNAGSWNEMYECHENELDVINQKINSLKSKPEIRTSENNIAELRKVIEDYFEEMNK